jgi:hypothetical protein
VFHPAFLALQANVFLDHPCTIKNCKNVVVRLGIKDYSEREYLNPQDFLYEKDRIYFSIGMLKFLI